MHDLNTINRLNREAFAGAIENFRKQGRFVLARYEGATLFSLETFSELTHAQWALDLTPATASQGQRAVIFVPYAYPTGGRDQSEDRAQPYTLEQLAALGRSGEKTLGDYIARKSDLLDNPKE